MKVFPYGVEAKMNVCLDDFYRVKRTDDLVSSFDAPLFGGDGQGKGTDKSSFYGNSQGSSQPVTPCFNGSSYNSIFDHDAPTQQSSYGQEQAFAQEAGFGQQQMSASGQQAPDDLYTTIWQYIFTILCAICDSTKDVSAALKLIEGMRSL